MESVRPVTSRPRTLRPLARNQDRVPSGSLIISDVFDSSESHGVDVARAAWSAGFEGPIFYQQAVETPLPPLAEHQRAITRLNSAVLTDEAVSQALRAFVVGPPQHMLLSATDEVERAGQSGASNSVLNLSSGTCKAQVASLLYRHGSKGRFGQNLARYLKLDAGSLACGDSKELGRFQQSVIDLVDRTWNEDSRIEELQSKFQETVRNFESNHNSVVIAAGNEGLVEPSMEMQSGSDLQVPDDFEQNVLESAEATHVGATIILDGKEAPARYSSNWPGVEFYASGDEEPGKPFDDTRGLGKAGSSLAAPRVGSLMAKLHGRNPELGSSQVEQLVRDRFANGSDAMLDLPRTQHFLMRD